MKPFFKVRAFPPPFAPPVDEEDGDVCENERATTVEATAAAAAFPRNCRRVCIKEKRATNEGRRSGEIEYAIVAATKRNLERLEAQERFASNGADDDDRAREQETDSRDAEGKSHRADPD